MSAAFVVERGDRMRMTFSGEKAKEALGGLVTNDVAALRAGTGLRAAALTPKGRVIALCRVFDRGPDLLVGDYKMILYPFIEGKDGFEIELNDHLLRNLGKALKAIHSVQVPPELKRQIPQETYSSQFRESMKSFQEQVENKTFEDPIAKKL